MFDDEFLISLPDDAILAADALCDEFFLVDKRLKEKDKIPGDSAESGFLNALRAITPNIDDHDIYIEALAAFQAYSEANDLFFEYPDLSSKKNENLKTIYAFFAIAKERLTADVTNLTLSRAKNKYAAQFGGVFAYEFSQGDLDKVQELINTLREEISKADGLDVEHQQRLLKRLEYLQSELHKKVSDLDKFWGLVGDAGVVLGKLGKDAKPIVDRIKEITEIIWRTQSRSEELPTDSKPALLNNSDKNE